MRATHYYALVGVEDRLGGLIRQTRDDDTLAFEYLSFSGTWVFDGALARYFLLGELGAEPVPERQAADLAVSLTGGRVRPRRWFKELEKGAPR